MNKEDVRYLCSIASYYIGKGEHIDGPLGEWLADALHKIAEGESADKALGLAGRGRKRLHYYIDRNIEIYHFVSDFDTGVRGDLTRGYDLAAERFPLEKKTIMTIYRKMREAYRASQEC